MKHEHDGEVEEDQEESPEVDTENEIEIVNDSPISNALRFALMRLTRLVLSVACELLAIGAGGMTAFFAALMVGWLFCNVLLFNEPGLWRSLWGFADTSRPWTWFCMNPYILLPVFIGLTILFLGQQLALGIPYRWKNTAPGSSVVLCSHCGEKIVDRLRCSHCNEFRYDGLAVKLVWGLNAAITTLWVAHDTIVAIVTLGGGKR